MRRLLVLRPEPGASATAARAEAEGWTVTVAPLFTIEACAWSAPDPGGFDGLILTSANAVRHAGPGLAGLRALPAHAVGAATADAARTAGFHVTTVGEGGIAELLPVIAATGARRFLHLTGEERRPGSHPDLSIVPITVYRAVPVRDMPAGVPTEGAIALLHSPRAAAVFAGLVDRASIRIAALSPAVADAAGPGWRDVAVADRPTDAGVLAAAARLCETGAR